MSPEEIIVAVTLTWLGLITLGLCITVSIVVGGAIKDWLQDE